MDVKTIALILCLEAVNVYTVEPSCSDAALGVNILEHTLETRTIVKLLHSEIAGIRDGLNCPTQSVNDRIQVDYIRQNLTQLSDKLEEMKAKLDSFVSQEAFEKPAFSVAVGPSRLDHVDHNQVIKFDVEILNLGGYYSKSTGQFTVPKDGVYTFSASIFADQNAEVWGYIKAGDKIVRINDRGTDNRHGQGSQTMVVALKSGENVTVHGGNKIYGYEYTTFSGYLIWYN